MAKNKISPGNYINIPLIKLDQRVTFKTLLIWLIVLIVLTAYIFILFIAFKSVDIAQLLGEELAQARDYLIGLMSVDDILNYYITQVLNNQFFAGIVFASVVSMGSLLREESKGMTEFLYAHELSRSKFAVSKLISAQISILLFNLVFTVASFVMINIADYFAFSFNIGMFLLVSLYVWIVHAIMGFIAFGIAGLLKGKNYLGISVGFGLIVIFTGSILGSILQTLAQGSIMIEIINHFLFTNMVLLGGSNNIKFDWICMLIYLAVASVLMVLGFINYKRKDLNC